MAHVRTVEDVLPARPTIEGAGVRLKRAFGHAQIPRFDPFLMLDDFHSDDPADYRAGFPWHPHRGIETITYVLHGYIEHADSMGNRGLIGPGDVQWMTAGRGVIHQEMPQDRTTGRSAGGETQGEHDERDSTLLRGFQLWANLPASHKMMEPRYREVKAAQIPLVDAGGGATVRVICGEVDGTVGPVKDVMIEPEYLDISLSPGARFTRNIPAEHTVFAYVIEGGVEFGGSSSPAVQSEHVVLFGSGDDVEASAPEGRARMLLVSGRPLHEPIAWGGPIVMNTEAELQVAMREYREGKFAK